jgi:GT2 family glycosyltransferase
LTECLRKYPPLTWEIIVVDNGSDDGTIKEIQNLKFKIQIIQNPRNLGFGKANNQGLKSASGRYILFLNSDVFVNDKVDFIQLLQYFKESDKAGAITVRINLPNGSIDPASHRGFPTLWRSFCYFIGLEKIFQNIPYLNKLFGGYHLVHLDLHHVHEIDSPTGAFYLAPRTVLNSMGGFDESFFMYGEDLDLSFRIKQSGYTILYIPRYAAVHHKGQSGIHHRDNDKIRKQMRKYFFEAMAIFYRKHYSHLYPSFLNRFVYFMIDIKIKLG